MRTLLLHVFLTTCVINASAQLHLFSNEEGVTLYVNYDALYNEEEVVEFSIMDICEINGEMTLHRVNRNGSDYEGPDFYEYEMADCYVSINVPSGEEATDLRVEISGACGCVEESSRDSEFTFTDLTEGEMNEEETATDYYGFTDHVLEMVEEMDCFESSTSDLKVSVKDMAMGECLGIVEEIEYFEDGMDVVTTYFSLYYDLDEDEFYVFAVRDEYGDLMEVEMSIEYKADYIIIDGDRYDQVPCE